MSYIDSGCAVAKGIEDKTRRRTVMLRKVLPVAVLMVVGIFACLSLAGCPPAVSAPAPPPTAYNELELVNWSNDVVSEVYLTPVNASDWGSNQLDYYLEYGDSWVLDGIPDGTYDLWAVGYYGASWELYGIEFYGGVRQSFDLN